MIKKLIYRSFTSRNNKQALLEIIEDSPYKFLSTTPPKNFASMKELNEGSDIHSTFKEVYRQFLLELTTPTRPLLKEMTS